MRKIKMITLIVFVVLCGCNNSSNYGSYLTDCERYGYANLHVNNSRMKNFDVYINNVFVGQVLANSSSEFRIDANKEIFVKVKQSQGDLIGVKTIYKTVNTPSCSDYIIEVKPL